MSISRFAAWSIWFIISIFYAYQYILRVMPNIMLADITQQFNIDAAIFGQFSGAYYIGYCIAHLPIGIMLDKYGPRKVMSICILLTVIGILPIIYAENYIYPIIGRVLIGIGSSAAILGAFKVIRMIFSEGYFTRMLSISVTIGLIGAIYSGGPVSYLCESYGYKVVIKLFALFGIIFAFVTYMLVPEIEKEYKSTVLNDLKTVISNPKVMIICFLAGLMVGPMEGFADAWGAEFLKQIYGLESKQANYLTSMVYIGMCFAPVLSRIAEKTGYYIRTIAGAGIFMLLIFTLLVLSLLNSGSMALCLFIVGICCAYQILAIYKASTYVPENVVGLTTATANMIIMSFGYIFHSGIGYVIKVTGKYGATSFNYGIATIPIALFIGSTGFIILSIKEKKGDKNNFLK